MDSIFIFALEQVQGPGEAVLVPVEMWGVEVGKELGSTEGPLTLSPELSGC